MRKQFNTFAPSDLNYNSNVDAGTRHRALSAKFTDTKNTQSSSRESPVIRVYFTFPLHTQTHVHSQLYRNMCSPATSCAAPLKNHPSGYNVRMTEDVRLYACDLSGRNTCGKPNVQLLPSSASRVSSGEGR